MGIAKRNRKIKSKFDATLREMVASGKYRMNLDGRVESARKYERGRELSVPWHVCDYDDGKGYLSLSYKGRRVKAHRLAYLLYHSDAAIRGKEINHLDGNRANNRKDNLEICDSRRQSKHAFETGLNRNIGANHHLAKLSEAKVIEMRNRRAATGASYAKLAQEFGVTPRAAYAACVGITWSHVKD